MSNDMTVKSVNFEDSTIEELEAVMDDYGVGFSKAVRMAVNNTLHNDDESTFTRQRLQSLRAEREQIDSEIDALEERIDD